MKTISAIRIFFAAILLALFGATAHAGETNAYCDVHKHGDKAKGATGNCTVIEQEGSVSIKLANGDHFDLTQKQKKNQFKDQKGNPVEKNVRGDGTTRYKWESKNIVVAFHGEEKKKK